MASDDKKKSRRRQQTEKGFRPYHSVSVPKSVDLVHSRSPAIKGTVVYHENLRCNVT